MLSFLPNLSKVLLNIIDSYLYSIVSAYLVICNYLANTVISLYFVYLFHNLCNRYYFIQRDGLIWHIYGLLYLLCMVILEYIYWLCLLVILPVKEYI